MSGRPNVSMYDRVEEYKSQGLYVFDAKKKEVMCQNCNVRVAWEKKSTIENHCKSTTHINKKKARESEDEKSKGKRQTSLSDSLEKAKKAKSEKEELMSDTVTAFLKANIPLHKIDHPEIRKWLDKHVKGSGDLPNARWLRKKVVPEIKEDYDEKIKNLVKDKPICILCDETTNRKGEAVFLTMFKILPTEDNAEPILVVASVVTLEVCSADQCCKAVIQALNKFDVKFENVVAVSSDSAPYMTLLAKLLRELVNPFLVHIQCWEHKLDKVSKVFGEKLKRLNECVVNTKKLFKNTRKRRNKYMKHLQDKYKFTKKKVPKLFPLPVISRWKSWKKACVYLSEYVEDVQDYAKTLKERDVSAVKYFKDLSEEDLNIIQAEAFFVKDYCGPVEELMLTLEGSKYPTAHVLYPKVKELCAAFAVVKDSKDVKSILPKETKSCVLKLRKVKQENLVDRFKAAAKSCHDLLTGYLGSDPGKDLFESVAGLFSPTKMMSVMLMEHSDRFTHVIKLKEKLYVLRDIPNSSFVTLHSLLVDQVSDLLGQKSRGKNNETGVIETAILAMRENHPIFAILCLQALYTPTSNSDVERGFSAYNDIVSPKRCRLLEGNAEVCLCLYLDVEPVDETEPTVQDSTLQEYEDRNVDPDDDFRVM